MPRAPSRSNSPSAAVEVTGLGKAFRGRRVLHDVTLAVARGEIVALLGENGAGKSTILRILSTTVRADAGRARVMGCDVLEEPAKVRASLGVMFGEDRGWYWRISARRNIEFFGVIGGSPRSWVRTRGEQLLEELDLADAGAQAVGTFSSGMRARLGLVRALLLDPPVLLLDEPSSHLDPIAAADMRRRLMALRERGTAVLIATHDLHEAAEIADRTVGLVAGGVAFEVPRGESPRRLEDRMIEAKQARRALA